MKDYDNLLPVADKEALRIYDHNSAPRKLVGEKLRNVFKKLVTGLKDKNGNPVNLDDFYFTVSANSQPNAFFISSQYTADKKTNIICVTDSLINSLNKEDHLAAVIAHETGHYIWDQLLGGTNTVYQERFADINSVDLMIRGGYNPRYVIDMFYRIGGTGNAHAVNFDVHGAQRSRVEDVEACLTNLTNTQGRIFEEIDGDTRAPDWAQFDSDVQIATGTDVYFTYFEKALKQKFGTNVVTLIPHNDLLRWFIDEINSGRINSAIRERHLLEVLSELKFTTPPDADIVYNLVMTILNKTEWYREQRSNNTDYVYSFLANAKVESRGKFTELLKVRKDFVTAVNSFDKTAIEKTAQEIITANTLNKYVRLFTDFNADAENIKPQGEKNVGYPMPWDFGQRIIGFGSAMLYFPSVDTLKSKFQEELKSYKFDESGKVLAYGEGVKEYNRKKIYEIYDRTAKKQFDDIKHTLARNNLWAQLGRGDISVSEYMQRIKGLGYTLDGIYVFYNTIDREVYDNISDIWGDKEYRLVADILGDKKLSDVENDPEYPYRSPYLEEMYQTVKESEFYKYFVHSDSSDVAYNEFVYTARPEDMTTNQIMNMIQSLFNRRRYVSASEKYFDICLKFADYYKSQGDERSAGVVLNTVLARATYNVYNPVSEEFYSAGIRGEISGDFDKDARDRLEIISKHEQTKMRNLIQRVKSTALMKISKNQAVLQYANTYMENALEQGLTYDASSVLLENMLGITGKKFPTKQQELVSIIRDSWYVRYAIFYIAEYIKRGYDFDPFIILELNNKFTVNSFNAQKILADWINKNNYLRGLSLERKMSLYMILDSENMFSSAHANKNQLIKLIVDEIVKTQTPEKIKYAENILTGVDYLTGEPKPNKIEFEFAIQREQLIEYISNYYATQLGRDDETPEYAERAKQIAGRFTEKSASKNDFKYDYMTAKNILDAISTKILAQESVARIFDDAATRKINNETAVANDFFGRAAQEMLNHLTETPERALAGIEFLNEKLSDRSIEKFINVLNGVADRKEYFKELFSKQNLMVMHQNFWAANLEVRSYLMAKLLKAYKGNDNNKGIDLAVDLFFEKDSEYYADAKLVLTSLYNNLEDYERDLILAAVTAASQRDDNNNMTGGETIGRGLKMFFAAKGAAFIKFGQLLSYMPMLDSDIRKELSTMRDNAKVPTRMELIDMINNTLPPAERKKISYVGKILGAGSFFVSVQVTYNGKDAVIALKRPHTNDLTSSGMDLIVNTIDDLIVADNKYKPLRNIAEQARVSAQSEIDIKQDYAKYQQAIKIYEGFSVETPNGTYSPDVARWYAYGESDNGEYAYKIMEMADGESLISNSMSEEEKHDAALAYVTLELSILLSGQKWDTDRHQGQQNFYNSSFKNFMIGIFDTGAQMDYEPSRFDKLMLGSLLYSLANSVRSGKSISDVLMNVVKKMDKFAETLRQDTAYIDGVQRGLTALSDIIEYQKEIKDSDGNIIQESKSLTTDDFIKIINAIYKSGLIDKTVKRSVVASAIIDNIVPDTGTLKMLQMLNSETDASDIVVNYTPVESKHKRRSKFRALSSEEIQEKLDSKKILGINRNLTEKENNTSMPVKEAMGF